MPIFRSKDSRGSFYKASRRSTAKYYYTPGNRASRLRALRRARRQMVAIEINQRERGR